MFAGLAIFLSLHFTSWPDLFSSRVRLRHLILVSGTARRNKRGVGHFHLSLSFDHSFKPCHDTRKHSSILA
jgi:hypothetical protein